MYNATLKGTYATGKHFIQFGNSIQQNNITDKLKETWNTRIAPVILFLITRHQSQFRSLRSTADLSIQKFSGYVQDNIRLGKNNKDITLQAGIRYNYNSLNKEFLVSSRMQLSWKPKWKKDVVFKMAGGVYQQPPFYREPSVNTTAV